LLVGPDMAAAIVAAFVAELGEKGPSRIAG
jgi:hypothetical protein